MLQATLDPTVRLAVAYAPAHLRPLHLAVFALDARLRELVAGAREPVLAQLKLAWWRDRLNQAPADRPLGEPLLAALAVWPGEAAPLLALIDGWEAMLDQDDPGRGIAALARARAELAAGLAQCVGATGDAEEAGRALHDWTLAELAGTATEGPRIDLPRSLRPLAVLHGLARRAQGQGRGGGVAGLLALAAAVRIGMLGR